MRDQYQEILREYAVMNFYQYKVLIKKARKGNKKAKRKVLAGVFPLILSEASKFKYINRLSHDQFHDLVQEGSIGALKAMEKYDLNPEKHANFPTYAQKRIYKSLQRGIDQFRIMHLPEHVRENAHKVFHAEKLYEKEGIQATPQMISELVGLSEEKVAEILNYYSRTTFNVSLNKEIFKDLTLEGVLSSETKPFHKDIAQRELEKVIAKFLDDVYPVEPGTKLNQGKKNPEVNFRKRIIFEDSVNGERYTVTAEKLNQAKQNVAAIFERMQLRFKEYVLANKENFLGYDPILDKAIRRL